MIYPGMPTSMEWLNFRHLYAFWAVCRHGGFAKAGAQIHVSQSTVSDQVAQLENYLEETLFTRTTRSVRVTERGASLLKVADEIFARGSEINRVFRDKQESAASANLRVGMVGGVSRNFIFGLISSILAKGRGMKIEVVDGSFDELNELLKTFELDLVLSLEKPRHKELLALTSKRVARSPLCLAGTPEIVRKVERRRRKPLGVELYTLRYPFDGSEPATLLAKRHQLQPYIPVTTDDISLLRFLANAGRGLALLPEIGVQEDFSSGALSRIRIDNAPSVEFYATFSRSSPHRELIDEVLAWDTGE